MMKLKDLSSYRAIRQVGVRNHHVRVCEPVCRYPNTNIATLYYGRTWRMEAYVRACHPWHVKTSQRIARVFVDARR